MGSIRFVEILDVRRKGGKKRMIQGKIEPQMRKFCSREIHL
jgi:hypothetical protein